MGNTIRDEQAQVLIHALGLDRGDVEYRNRYCPGGGDVAICAALEELGYMTGHDVDWILDRVYCVTDEGKRVAKAYKKQGG